MPASVKPATQASDAGHHERRPEVLGRDSGEDERDAGRHGRRREPQAPARPAKPSRSRSAAGQEQQLELAEVAVRLQQALVADASFRPAGGERREHDPERSAGNGGDSAQTSGDPHDVLLLVGMVRSYGP